jgi:type VI secretion system secreted protein VgrG
VPRNLNIAFDVNGIAPLRVIRFDEEETLGIPSALDIEVRWGGYEAIEDMVGHPATLSLGFGDDPPHVFRGIVEEATAIGSSITAGGEMYAYVLRVVPRIAVLARSVDSRIFQDKDVKEIVTQVLADHAIEGDAVEWRLTAAYAKRAYCVQYQESALAFISRLCEEEGIYFFVEGSVDVDKVVFADDSTAAAPIEGEAELQVRANPGTTIDRDHALVPADHRRVRAGKFVLRDYNFEKPALDLTATAEAAEHTELEIYDFPGRYDDKSVGDRLTRVRLEAEQVLGSTLTIRAACPRVTAGRKLKLADAGDLDGEYFCMRVRHRYEHGGDDQPSDYEVTAAAIPVAVPYRLPQRTPRPFIEGPQTARVVAPANSVDETIHTDKHGRCKVKFHWDRSDLLDDRATFWMRVAQLQTSGSMVLPRVNWEVIVDFIEGDPDRPLITGRLYNGTYMPPYALPEGKTRTSIKTVSSPGGGGSNEIRLEDKAGSEEIMIHAQKDMTMATANNKKKNVGNNETSVIGANSSLSVGADQQVKITKGSQNTVTGDQSVSVGGNRNVEVNAVTGLTIHGSATTTVGGNQMEMDGNPLEALLALAAQKAAEYAAAKAGEAIARVQGHVQGAVDQALGPINNLTAQANQIGAGMQAVANGDMGAMAGMAAGAAGIPGASQMGAAMAGGPAATRSAPGTDGTSSGGVSGGNMISAAANTAIQRATGAATAAAGGAIAGGVEAGRSAIASALGLDGGGGGGSSQANAAGPAGAVGGQDETDRAKGPGHAIGVIAGSQTDTVGGMKIVGVLNGMNTNVAGSMTQNAGAAHLEVVIGSRAESVEGMKNEKALGLVVLSKGGESEQVSAAKTTMVGGAIIDKLKGSHAVQANAPATFIGAFHKMEAKTSITLTCGASTVRIDNAGIRIESPLVTIMAGKIVASKTVLEN